LLEKYLHPISFFGGFLFYPLQHLFRLITSTEYRQLIRYSLFLAHKKRYTDVSVKLNGQKVLVPDSPSFISMFDEIYYKKIYEIPHSEPRILDLGANIGISLIWFKEKYPQSSILAFEADPFIFSYLKLNTSNLSNVTIKNEAVWSEDTTLSFASDGGDAGRVSDDGDVQEKTVSVEAKDIKLILKEHGPFDFIKMDIEGAESTVVPECKGLLGEVKFFFCEYHSTKSDDQYLDVLISFFKEEGFRVHMQPITFGEQPFMATPNKLGYDMQSNIFAFRE
jgi:FkbM family methyltransferase